MTITEALDALDPSIDKQWTTDGLPRVEAVSETLGRNVTRREITDAAPNFLRPVAEDPGDHIKDPDTAPAEEAPGSPVEAPAETPSEAPAETPEEQETPVEAAPEVPTEAPPAEDSEQAAVVKIHDQVMAMNFDLVKEDPDLLDRAITEFGRQATILVARREAIIAKLNAIGRRSALFSTHRDRVGPRNTDIERRERVKAIQETSRRIREEKVRSRQKFIEAGTTPEDVLEGLTATSKLDTAMKQRKPVRSMVRPVFPVTG